MIGLVVAVSISGALAELPRLQDIPPLPAIRRDPQITYLDRSGQVIGVRGGRYAPPVDVSRLPDHVPAAFVSIEDRRFYEHGGVDPMGIARALVADIADGKRQGASTITQQTVKNVFLNANQTVERKAKEAVMAVQLEQTYSKKQILGLYLSRVYFGEGAYGLEAAAQRYFNKPAVKLTVREAAMLAAILKAPSSYNPVDQPEKSAERTALVWTPWSRRVPLPPLNVPRPWLTSPRSGRPRPPLQLNISSTGSIRKSGRRSACRSPISLSKRPLTFDWRAKQPMRFDGPSRPTPNRGSSKLPLSPSTAQGLCGHLSAAQITP